MSPQRHPEQNRDGGLKEITLAVIALTCAGVAAVESARHSMDTAALAGVAAMTSAVFTSR